MNLEYNVIPTQRQRAYISGNFSKLLSLKHLGRLVRDPSIPFKHARSLLTDRNFIEYKPAEELAIYRDSIAALSNLIAEPKRQKVSFTEDDPNIRDLGALFKHHGSDKATLHDYERIYGTILAGKRQAALNILEIGLGTNNLDVLSNMGLWGKPGASLRAFRDWAPKAAVFGADVDKRILFNEERIATYWVDQANLSSLMGLVSQIGERKFDLIIDDGLHLPHANFNTLSALLPLLKPDGAFVVEDILPIHLPFWHVAQAALHQYDAQLIDAKGGGVFVLRH
jgi:hypothetical protein